MYKKRKIDFVLYDNGYEQIIFRFRPNQSRCHSFDEKPPTKWEEVYKVYYSYSIFSRRKVDNSVKVLFDCVFDECSVIDEVAARIRLISNGQTVITRMYDDEVVSINLLNEEIIPCGDGVSWTIKQYVSKLPEIIPDYYEIELWKYNHFGYRFSMDKDKFKAFGEYLQECCDYMLAHGEPI